MRYFKLLLLAAGAFVLAGAVLVQEVNAQSDDAKFKTIFETKFNEMDKNKNGSVPVGQFVDFNRDSMIKNYMGLDKDRNAVVSVDEFVSLRVKMGEPEAQAQKDFEALDSNGNGSFNEKEAVAYIDNHLASQFKAWDLNSDGKLTKDEFVSSALKELKNAQMARAGAQK